MSDKKKRVLKTFSFTPDITRQKHVLTTFLTSDIFSSKIIIILTVPPLPPFRRFWRTAYQKMLKLAGQIDLDE
jgi:hypothetical protein